MPGGVKDAGGDLKNVLVTGELGNAKVVHIERLQINVNHLYDNAVNYNVQQFMADLDKLPVELPDKVVKAWEASKKKGES